MSGIFRKMSTKMVKIFKALRKALIGTSLLGTAAAAIHIYLWRNRKGQPIGEGRELMDPPSYVPLAHGFTEFVDYDGALLRALRVLGKHLKIQLPNILAKPPSSKNWWARRAAPAGEYRLCQQHKAHVYQASKPRQGQAFDSFSCSQQAST